MDTSQRSSISTAIILAAGRGTRMKSQHPKTMQLLGGQPLIKHLLRHVEEVFDRIVVVCAPDMKEVAEAVAPFPVVIQEQAQGTADAARAAEAYFGEGDVAILYADTPLISVETLRNLRRARQEEGADLVLLGMRPQNPGHYGRIVLDGKKVEKIVEWQDATEQERAIELCNAGGLCARGDQLAQWLNQVENHNKKEEYYLTDIVAIARHEHKDIYALEAPESELVGINSRADLAKAEANLQQTLISAALDGGVTFVAPQTVFLSADTSLEEDVVIEPHVIIGPNVTVQRGSRIRSFSYLEGCIIKPHAQIGPFARIRPHSTIGGNSKVGNFVEVKNSQLAQGVKASHLAYLGDVSCDENVNVGAGAVVCNFDGTHKHHSNVQKNVFIGSNSAIISPVTLGHNAFIAAGSTITQDVPPDTLAFGRAQQVNKSHKYDKNQK